MLKRLIALLCILKLCKAEVISGATFFVGGKSPIVETSYARFQGKDDILTRTSNYLGIQYASAPRFDHSIITSQPLPNIQDVSDYGPSCPQHDFISTFSPSDLGLGSLAGYLEATLSPIFKQSEECLFINIQRPLNMTTTKLPVLLWIHGGGFEAGAGQSFAGETTLAPGVFYQGANLVRRSQDMGQPIIVASINYRLNHFGFSASQEMADAGLLNLGLEDQRNAMKWIQQNIEAFGGDATKVTIMGESAGSWSVTAHLVANDGDHEDLFRAAVGISGGPLKVTDHQGRSQELFNSLVEFVDCASATNKIACLRLAPYEKLYEHAQGVNFLLGYRSLASAWTLRPDGHFLTKSPDILVSEGKIANVPLMYGDVADEGTLFSLVNSLNTTTTEEVKDYFKTYWWPDITEEQLDRLMELYPTSDEDTTLVQGLVKPGPQFKRISDITGDYSFQSQRRQLRAATTAPRYNYLIEQSVPLPLLPTLPLVSSILDKTSLTDIPILGSFHASDVILNWFGTLPETVSKNTYHLMGVLVAFVNEGNPNGHGMEDVPTWPQYEEEGKQTMLWKESGVDVVKDDWREEGMEFLNEIGDVLRI